MRSPNSRAPWTRHHARVVRCQTVSEARRGTRGWPRQATPEELRCDDMGFGFYAQLKRFGYYVLTVTLVVTALLAIPPFVGSSEPAYDELEVADLSVFAEPEEGQWCSVDDARFMNLAPAEKPDRGPRIEGQYFLRTLYSGGLPVTGIVTSRGIHTVEYQ